jgi:hypothetical protein
MGYTWKKIRPAAEHVIIRQESDWRNYPGTCRKFEIQGCAWRVGTTAYILVKYPVESYKGSCNTLTHELRHAMGETHLEAHSYTPRDHTR